MAPKQTSRNQNQQLPECSLEQKTIIDKLKTSNVVVDSVAGSGKTTTNLYIATTLKNKRILLLTYNSKLKLETRERIKKLSIKNLEAHSYHSFCVKYYNNKCYTDSEIIQILRKQTKNISAISYDIIILDEAQDITPLYYELICKITKDNTIKASYCVLGDKYQSIYEFNKADSRFITQSDKIYTFNDLKWEKCSLSFSFRVPHEISKFINECMIGYNRIKSNKLIQTKPRYVICDTYSEKKDNYIPLKELNRYINELNYSPDEIFVLAPSLKTMTSPVRILENYIKSYMPEIPIFVPSSDDQELDESVLKNKLVFSTFHQVKGLERKIVLVFGFDSSYFKFYKQNKDPSICPNELYVATTRSLERMTLFHHNKNSYLEFIDKNKLQQYADCIGNVRKTSGDKMKDAIIDTQVTDLLRHLPQDVTDNCFEYFKIINKRKASKKIDLLTKVQCIKNESKEFYESVNEINGIAIPSYFEYKKKNNMTIYNYCMKPPPCDINDKNMLLFEFWHNKVDSMENIEMDNLSGENLLYIATFYVSLSSKYLFKSFQISDYNWLTIDTLNLCIDRLNSLNISNNIVFEKSYCLADAEVLLNRKLCGRVDCFDDDNNVLYEFKCTDKLEKEHYLQLACYMYLDLMEKQKLVKNIKNSVNDEVAYKFNEDDEDNIGIITKILKNGTINIKNSITGKTDKVNETDIIENVTQTENLQNMTTKYYLYNILTDQLDEIVGDLENIKKMMTYIIQCKFGDSAKISDDEFLNKVRLLKQKYENNTKTNDITENVSNINVCRLSESCGKKYQCMFSVKC
jgi:hypothetical protein